jgi:hypothetical protein
MQWVAASHDSRFRYYLDAARSGGTDSRRAKKSTALGMIMRIIAGILLLAVLMWIETATAQTTYSLSVSRHRTLPKLSATEVKAILAAASKMLQKNSSHHSDDDTACNVTFTLKGPVRTFGSADTPAIVDAAHIEAVHRVDSTVTDVDFHVKVVREIDFCRPGLTGPFAGCSYSPPDFRSMIVVHPKLHKSDNGRTQRHYPDYLLWPHEFGHLTGLAHRQDPHALMTPCPLAKNDVKVNRRECQCLLSGPASCPLPQPVTCQ